MAAHSDADPSAAFFTEESYETFSIRPRFDVQLFKLYNPSLASSQISPVKKGRQAEAGKSVLTSHKTDEPSASGQPGPSVPTCPAQVAPPSLKGQKDGSLSGGQRAPNKVTGWSLTSGKPRFPYPRYSCLTHAQQQRYIELWQKHSLRQVNQSRFATATDDVIEKQELRKLQIMVHKEQQDFLKYAEHVAQNSPEDYEHLSPLALKYVTELWKSQENRVKALPPHFSIYQTIGIVPAAIFPTDPVLTFTTRLLVLGHPPVIDGPALDRKVGKNLLFEASQHQPALSGRHGGARDALHEAHQELHDDENAVTLASKYRANIVLATAALATLADNHAPGYDRNWQIPVRIASAQTAGSASALKTVYMSGPLTTPYAAREASRVFHRAALRDLLADGPSGPGSLSAGPAARTTPAGTPRGGPTDVDVESPELDLTDLETFGSSSDKPSGRSRKELPKASTAEAQLASSEIKDGGRLPRQTLEQDDTMETSGSLVQPSPHHTSPRASRPIVPSGIFPQKQEGLMRSRSTDPPKLSSEAPSEAPLEGSPAIGDAPEEMPELEVQGDRKDCDPESSSLRGAVSREPLGGALGSDGRASSPEQSASGQSASASGGGVSGSLPRVSDERGERPFPSDGSETGGDLMMALSSEADSPARTSGDRPAPAWTGTGGETPGSATQETDPEALATGERPGHPGEPPTPRRSKRLLKRQPWEADIPSSPPAPSGRMPKPRLLSVEEPRIDKGKTPLPDHLSDRSALGGIPDSPLSPPPSERGPAPVWSASLMGADDDMSVPGGCPLQDVPLSASPQPHKRLRADLPDSDPGSGQAPLRYNLRSKAAGGAAEESSRCPAEDLKAEADTRYPTTNTEPPASDAHSPPANPHREGSKDSADVEWRKPQRLPAAGQNPAGKAEAVPQSETGVETTIDSILRLQARLHKGKAASQSPLQPPVGAGPGEVFAEDPSQYEAPGEGCVDYSMWQFGRHSVIVKSDIDAVCSVDSASDKLQPAIIVPKMEYQPHFGYEQISNSELTKLWMSLLLRPGSKVIQGRVNALTSDLMMLDHFDMNSSLWEQPSFQPSCCMKMMFQILDKLTSLPEGSYLLCHSTGDMHACILQTAAPKGNRRSSFDLRRNYIQVPLMQSCPPAPLPWLPLDTNMILPSQRTQGRIPATFPPKKNVGGNVKGAAKGTTKKKKKKKSQK